MKKGDMRREELLRAAERLFYTKGYEKTSVQDILAQINLSKGGFYHHFQSKEAILAEICENRVVSSLSELKWELFSVKASPIERMNLLLRKVNLFDRENTAFVALMLKICYVDGDVRIRDRMRSVVLSILSPFVDDVIAEGMKSGDFFTRNPGQLGAIILGMTSTMDEDACRILAADAENPECIIEIADRLNAYRDSIETLLGAPYASIVLFDPAELVSDYRAAAKELLKLEEK